MSSCESVRGIVGSGAMAASGDWADIRYQGRNVSLASNAKKLKEYVYHGDQWPPRNR